MPTPRSVVSEGVDADTPAPDDVQRWDSPEDYPTWDYYFLIRWALLFVVVLGFAAIIFFGL